MIIFTPWDVIIFAVVGFFLAAWLFLMGLAFVIEQFNKAKTAIKSKLTAWFGRGNKA